MTSTARYKPQLVVKLQRLSHKWDRRKLTRPFARAIEIFIRLIWNASLPPGAKIDATAHFGHNALAVVVNRQSVVGPNCNIGVHVVLGGRAPIMGAPRLGSNVIVHSGAKIIGPITIGDNCVIGANAVVTKDIPSNCVAVGVPARIVKRDIDIEDYS